MVCTVSQGNLAPRGRGGGRPLFSGRSRSDKERGRTEKGGRGAGGGCAVSLWYRRVINFSVIGKPLQDVHGQAFPTPACGGRDGREERPSEGGGKSPPPLAGEGTPSEARRGRGNSAAACLRPGISHPRLRGKGRERSDRGRGPIPAPACGGGGCERSEKGEGEFCCRMSTARLITIMLFCYLI